MLRKRRHLSQRELAPLAGISSGYVSRIELGLDRPDPLVLRDLAKALETSEEELLRLAGYVPGRIPLGDEAQLIAALDRMEAQAMGAIQEARDLIRRLLGARQVGDEPDGEGADGRVQENEARESEPGSGIDQLNGEPGAEGQMQGDSDGKPEGQHRPPELGESPSY